MKKRFLPFYFLLSMSFLSLFSFGSNYGDETNGSLSKEKSPLKDHFTYLRVNQKSGIVNPNDVINARKQSQNLNLNRGEDLKWHIIGPDNYGGRTRAVLYDKNDASGKTIYAGGVTGGLWKSSDNGMTWTKINPDGSNLYVSCITQSDDGTIYVGTGEDFGSVDYSIFGEMGYETGIMGTGVYKSEDGDNFTLVPGTEPVIGDASNDWAYINEVQVKNNVIFVATNTGLHYSDDNGSTWHFAKDNNGNELTGKSLDVKAGDGIVVAVVDNVCYYSSGDPNNFINVSTGEEGKLPLPNGIKRAEFAIAPSDNSIAYVSLIKSNGNLYGIYRSENSGENWSLILPGSTTLEIYLYGGLFYNSITVFPNDPNRVILGAFDLWEGYQTEGGGLFYWEEESSAIVSEFSTKYLPYGIHAVSFRPNNPNEFIVGTNGGVFKGEKSSGTYEFHTANQKYYTTQFYTVGNSGLDNYVMGGTSDNEVLIMDQQSNSTGYARKLYPGVYLGGGGDVAVSLINPDVIVVGNAFGKIYRSEDRGENYSVNFHANSLSLNENFYTPFALWESFDNPYSRDSVWFYSGSHTYEGGSTIIVKSNNSNYPFEYTLPEDLTLNPGDSLLIQDPVSSRLFVGGTHHVYMTKYLHNFAKNTEWYDIANPDVGYTGTASAIAYSHDANHVFVGTTEGKVYRISNLALAYNKELADVNEPTSIVSVSELEIIDPETGNPMDQVVTSLYVDPEDPNRVIVTYGNYGNSNYVFYTEDALDQSPVFVSKQGNLPHMPVYSSVIEMLDSKLAIIGTDLGIYKTEDITADDVVWQEADMGMGKVPVLDLKQQTVKQESVTLDNGTEQIVYPGALNYGLLYAAAYGRGIFRCDNFRQPVGIGEVYSDNNSNGLNAYIYPNPVNENLNLELKTKVKGDVSIDIYDITGRNVLTKNLTSAQKFTINVTDLSRGAYFLVIKNSKRIETLKFVKY